MGSLKILVPELLSFLFFLLIVFKLPVEAAYWVLHCALNLHTLPFMPVLVRELSGPPLRLQPISSRQPVEVQHLDNQ